MNIEQYIFKNKNQLSDFQTFEKIDNAKKLLKETRKKLSKLQDVMYAHNQYGVLVGLQGMDTSGKDSLVREVFKDVNANGVKVHSFKVPTDEELGHDYLWRHVLKLPARGIISVFNRTHYENVLVTRVHKSYILGEKIPNYESLEKITDDFYQERMEQINAFEKHLVQNGTIVLKFFMYLSKEEQKNRLLRRLEIPKKNWKFSAGDLKERKLWDAYQLAYENMLQNTSTKDTPWYIIPADNKETSRYIVANIMTQLLSQYGFKYPELTEEEKNNLEIYKRDLYNS